MLTEKVLGLQSHGVYLDEFFLTMFTKIVSLKSSPVVNGQTVLMLSDIVILKYHLLCSLLTDLYAVYSLCEFKAEWQ